MNSKSQSRCDAEKVPVLYRNGNGDWIMLGDSGEKFEIAMRGSPLERAMSARLSTASEKPPSATRASLAEPRAHQLDQQQNPRTDALAAYLQNDASADDLGRLTRMKWHARQMEREAGYWRHVAEVLDRPSARAGARDTLDALDNQHRSEGTTKGKS